jgi:membrane protein DedA with SNARE-associated domain
MVDILEGLVQQHGYWIVGVVIALEAMGLPLPGESLMIAAAIYAATTHNLAIEWIVLSAAVGAIMGDNIGYLIGHRLGRRALERYGPRIGLTVPRQRLGQFLFLKYGGIVVFIGRFVAFLRVFAALLAGANRMRWGRFLMWNALGGIAWTHLYGIGAYMLGSQAHKLAGPFGLVMGGIAAVVVVAVVSFLKKNEHRLIREAEAEMTAHELRLEQKHGKRVVVPAAAECAPGADKP